GGADKIKGPYRPLKNGMSTEFNKKLN
ncbi:hypothetical protein RED65_08279 [Oceanobacter sp. RED65]|nr:hypothetical protein RED65_08279 [Oceanobacter sp. RED65] [Bermanella marisrubri]